MKQIAKYKTYETGLYNGACTCILIVFYNNMELYDGYLDKPWRYSFEVLLRFQDTSYLQSSDWDSDTFWYDISYLHHMNENIQKHQSSHPSYRELKNQIWLLVLQ